MRVGGDDAVNTYADFASIRKKGNTVKMWFIYDHKTAERSPEGKAYLSSNRQAEFDCQGEVWRMLHFSLYSANIGLGKVVYTDATPPSGWRPVPSESLIEVLLK